MKRDKALLRAIAAAGGVVALAKRLRIAPQAVSQWNKAPVGRVLGIEKACAGEVTRYQLRPDIYGRK